MGTEIDEIWALENLAEPANNYNNMYIDNIEPFAREDCGPKLHIGEVKSPLHFFQKFYTNQLLDKFVTESNKYATGTKRNRWKSLTIGRFNQFLAIICYMGVTKLPTRRHYWSDGVFKQPFVSDIMSFEDFNSILLCWHYIDTTPYNIMEIKNRNNIDPFWCLADYINDLNILSQSLFQPFRNIDIDEQCIPFKGRHLAKQYNPHKPNKWHLKVYSMNDSQTGYMYSFYIYRGIREVRPNNISASNFPAFILTENNSIQHANYLLYTDNYFTSIESLELMLTKGIYQIGTVRKNKLGTGRNLVIKPSDKRQRGTIVAYKQTNSEIRIISWQDKKPVNLLSSVPAKITQVNRTGDNGHVFKLNCPNLICLYNKSMGGTDGFDQKLTYYWPQIRSTKWTVRVLIHFMYVSIINSHILFKNYFHLTRKDPCYDLLGYITTLMSELVTIPENNNSNIRVPRNPFSQEQQLVRFSGKHTPVKVPRYELDANGNEKRVYKRAICGVCKLETSFKCMKCNRGLHIKESGISNCFETWHDHNWDGNKVMNDD